MKAQRLSIVQMRRWRASWRRILRLSVLGTLVGLTANGSFFSSAASASDENRWWLQSDSQQSPTWNQSYDRSYAAAHQPAPNGGAATLSRSGMRAMKVAIKRYSAIVKKGGWKPIPKSSVTAKLRSGSSNQTVRLLRKRLVLTGDLLQEHGYPSTFDYYVANALRRFQNRHGLSPTGDLINRSRRFKNGTRTLTALNVSAEARLKQLRANLKRMSSLSARTGKTYVIVNIPAAQVEAVENGRVVSRHVAVVGKRERATPILASRIHEINFNPVWTLPPTVIRKDLIPKGRQLARKSQSVLEKYGIDAYNGYGGRKLNPKKINWRSSAVYSYVYRQEPGPSNPLGFVKINFHNGHAVYMHDTPSKRIFGRNIRTASSGCVRVQNIPRLVTWLLRDNSGWNHNQVMRMKRSGKRMDVKVKRSVPLHFAYITAWTSPRGVVSFREDIYGRDTRLGVSRMAANY